jgi:acyl carrier protein
MDELPMRNQSIQDSKLQAAIEVVAKALDLSADTLSPESSMENTPAWDSTTHMTICLALEQRFGKSMDLDTVYNATSVRELAAFIP